MELISKKININFMGFRRPAVGVSSVLMALAVVMLVWRGLNFGIDFTGGTLIEVGYQNDIELESVRNAMAEGGFDGATVQRFGTPRDVLIRLAPSASGEGTNAALSDRVFASLSAAADGTVELRRVEFVGPQVGDELAEDGALAVLVALLAILVYVALRFEWRFAVGAVAALVHDVLLTVGLFALLQFEFGLPVLAAVWYLD